MTLGSNIRVLMDLYDCTYAEVGEAAGTSEQAIQQLVSRNSQRSTFSAPIASYFGLPLEILLGENSDLLKTKSRHPKRGNTTNIDNNTATFLVTENAPAPYTSGIPVIATIKRAGREGIGMSLEYEDGLGFVSLPSKDPHAYALKVHGQDYSPRVRHGEYLVIEPSLAFHPGDEVVICIKDDDALKFGVFTYSRGGLSHFDGLNGDGGKFHVYDESIKYIRVISAIAKQSLVNGISYDK